MPFSSRCWRIRSIRFKALYNRIEMKQVEALVEASKEEVKATAAPVTGPLADDPIQGDHHL